MYRRGVLIGGFCLLVLISLSGTGWAHPELLGSMEGKVDGKVLHLNITVLQDMDIANPERFGKGLRYVMSFTNNSRPCSLNVNRVKNGMPTSIAVDVVCGEAIGSLDMHSEFMVNEGWQFAVYMGKDGVTKPVIMDGDNEDAKFDLRSENVPAAVKVSWGATLHRFILMGMEHIYTGYDHILFVLALILVSTELWPLVKTVTAFTIAHSITLILSTLNIVHVSSRVVEPMIAFSIAYVAFEDLVNDYRRRKDPSRQFHSKRWLVAFGFGLFHGLGFSGALKDINIPQPIIIPSLLSFNVGVELAQISIIAVAMPVLYYLKSFRWQPRLVHALLLIIGLLGTAWFVERVIS